MNVVLGSVSPYTAFFLLLSPTPMDLTLDRKSISLSPSSQKIKEAQ